MSLFLTEGISSSSSTINRSLTPDVGPHSDTIIFMNVKNIGAYILTYIVIIAESNLLVYIIITVNNIIERSVHFEVLS